MPKLHLQVAGAAPPLVLGCVGVRECLRLTRLRAGLPLAWIFDGSQLILPETNQIYKTAIAQLDGLRSSAGGC